MFEIVTLPLLSVHVTVRLNVKEDEVEFLIRQVEPPALYVVWLLENLMKKTVVITGEAPVVVARISMVCKNAPVAVKSVGFV